MYAMFMYVILAMKRYVCHVHVYDGCDTVCYSVCMSLIDMS